MEPSKQQDSTRFIYLPGKSSLATAVLDVHDTSIILQRRVVTMKQLDWGEDDGGEVIITRGSARLVLEEAINNYTKQAKRQRCHRLLRAWALLIVFLSSLAILAVSVSPDISVSMPNAAVIASGIALVALSALSVVTMWKDSERKDYGRGDDPMREIEKWVTTDDGVSPILYSQDFSCDDESFRIAHIQPVSSETRGIIAEILDQPGGCEAATKVLERIGSQNFEAIQDRAQKRREILENEESLAKQEHQNNVDSLANNALAKIGLEPPNDSH